VQLYSYFRSSASYRVRIALALKGLDYDYLSVQLVKNEQFGAPFDAIAPGHLVPVLKDGDGTLNQSLAIIEYLDETHPTPPLLPGDARARAQIRALALDIACEIHPLNNLRVLRYLVDELKVSEDDKNRWYRHWVETGLEAVERQIVRNGAGGRYCHGDTPTLADCVLVPQIFNAQRLACRTDHVPTVMRACEAWMRRDAF
jgi:maleylacetoacetate isomerase/maleylpyruvate isomerase